MNQFAKRAGLGLCVVLLAAMVICWSPPVALARAGGGQGYHGGSSHSSGGGYHGGGGFGGGGFGGSYSSGGGMPLSGGGVLCVLVLVVCIIIVVLIVANSQQPTRVMRRAQVLQWDDLRRQALLKLAEIDPAFNEQLFYERVRAAFQKIQDAWSGQELTAVRAFLSDGILERFALQIQEQKELGYRNQLDHIEIHDVQLSEVETDEFFDRATVRIAASAIDYRVELGTNRPISGSHAPERFVEFWDFLRRHGTVSTGRDGLIEGNCPNCGAQIQENQLTTCASCGSLLRSGEYDWVLVEITQECEWSPADARDVPGLVNYRASADPGLNTQHLEDRASVIFWRRVMADRLGDLKPLAKLATPEFCERYAPMLSPKDGQRRYWGECALGSVTTLGVLPGQQQDRVLLELRWSGTWYQVQDHKRRPLNEGALVRSLFELARNRGVKSDVGRSISSAHCPNCGAPETNLLSNACEFCGEVLNDGSHDWVLCELQPMDGATAQNLLIELATASQAAAPVLQEVSTSGAVSGVGAALATAPNVAAPAAASAPATASPAAAPLRAEVVAWAVRAALADGRLDPQESTALNNLARRCGVPRDRLDKLIGAAQRGQLEVPQPRDPAERHRWLSLMADMALIDGRLEPTEYDMLCQVGKQLQLSDADVKLLISKRKAALYQGAKERLKKSRQ